MQSTGSTLIVGFLGKKQNGPWDRSVSYPFFSGYGRDEAFPQDTDQSPVPLVQRWQDH